MRNSLVILALFGIVDARHFHLIQKDEEEPSVVGWVKNHPDYEGMVNGRSKLVKDEYPAPSEWSTLPYGPYPQKKFAWDDKVIGAKSGS